MKRQKNRSMVSAHRKDFAMFLEKLEAGIPLKSIREQYYNDKIQRNVKK